jgi:hypothetical protein
MKKMFAQIDMHSQWDKRSATKPTSPREKPPSETDLNGEKKGNPAPY